MTRVYLPLTVGASLLNKVFFSLSLTCFGAGAGGVAEKGNKQQVVFVHFANSNKKKICLLFLALFLGMLLLTELLFLSCHFIGKCDA